MLALVGLPGGAGGRRGVEGAPLRRLATHRLPGPAGRPNPYVCNTYNPGYVGGYSGPFRAERSSPSRPVASTRSSTVSRRIVPSLIPPIIRRSMTMRGSGAALSGPGMAGSSRGVADGCSRLASMTRRR